MWIRWEGCVSNHRNLSIFTFIAPISLTVCLPWQRLVSDQLCVALASALSLYSAHSGCIPACCQPNRPVPVAEREKSRWWKRRVDAEGWQKQQKAKNIREENVFYSVGGKLLIRAEVIGQLHGRSTVYPTVATVKFGQTFKSDTKNKISSRWSQLIGFLNKDLCNKVGASVGSHFRLPQHGNKETHWVTFYLTCNKGPWPDSELGYCS